MLQIDNLVFNAWGRRFFDQHEAVLHQLARALAGSSEHLVRGYPPAAQEAGDAQVAGVVAARMAHPHA